MFFALGVFLWIELTKESSLKNKAWISLFIVAGCIELYAQTRAFSLPQYVNCKYSAPIAIWLISVVLIILSVKFNKQLHGLPQGLLRAMRTAGLMTFPVYLLHQVAGNSFMGFLYKIGLDRWSSLAFTIVTVLVFSWVIASFLEPVLQSKLKANLRNLLVKNRLETNKTL